MLRFLDYPPVWLLAFLGLGWAQAAWLPLGQGTVGWAVPLGSVLALAGVALMLLALPQFLRAGTTVVPHRAPAQLITQGVYRLSRNPIYLGDALLLAGLLLRAEAWPALILVPAFVLVMNRRFIEPEEARLRAAFGADFDAFAARTRRWI